MNDLPIEIEEDEAEEKLIKKELMIAYFGSENTYYVDANEKEYFCKNYPSLD